MNRRSVLGTLATMGAAATSQTMSNGMLYRTLGKTGEKASATGLGGLSPRTSARPGGRYRDFANASVVRCVLRTSPSRNTSVSSARRWIDAFRLSIN